MGAMDAERLARLLVGKIGTLPAVYVAEIEAFIDSVVERAGSDIVSNDLTWRAGAASEASFSAVWDNPEDAVYDAL